MSIASRLSTPPAPKPSLTGMDRWIAEQSEVDAAAVLAAVRNPDWRHTDLLEALVYEGAPKVATTTFATWRKNHGWKK